MATMKDFVVKNGIVVGTTASIGTSATIAGYTAYHAGNLTLSTLGGAAKGANTDITSLAGLTTALSVAQGGTGAATISGLVYGNGTSAMTAATGTQIATALGTTNISGNAANVTGTVAVANGGTGATTIAGLVFGNGTSAMTAATGAQIATALGTTNISGNAANVTGTVAVPNGGTGATTISGLVFGNGTAAMTAATGSQIATALGTTNITGNAANVTGTVAVANGGTGATTASAALTNLGALPLAGGVMTGSLIMTNSVSISSKDSGGTNRAMMSLFSDNTMNIYNAGNTSVRILNQAGNTVLWSIDSNGVVSQTAPKIAANATYAAAGTTQATATAMTKEVNIVTSSTSGSAVGVILPTPVGAAQKAIVINTTANTITVWVNSSQYLNGTQNGSVTISANAALQFVSSDTTHWYALSAVYQ